MVKVTPRLVQVQGRPFDVRVTGIRLDDVRHLVVAREDKLGDFVLALPAVAAIRSAYPDAALSLIVDRSVVPLAETVPDVAAVIATDGTTSIRDLAASLRDIDADGLIAISRKPRAALAARLAGLRHRVGSGGRWWSPSLSRQIRESRRGGEHHEAEYALSFAHGVGASPEEPRFPIVLPEGARTAARQWLTDHDVSRPFVVLHPGSGGSCPPWPLGHYVQLAERLRGDGVTVVASIGPEDAACADAFAGFPQFRGGLPELAAVLDAASLVVSNTTGPLHLAAALDTPTLAIHPPWASCSAVRWGPYSAKGYALEAGCPEALSWTRQQRRADGAELMAAVTPEIVLRHVHDLLEPRV